MLFPTGSRCTSWLITWSISAPVKMPVWVKSEMPPFSQRGKLMKLPIIPHSALTMPMVFGPASSIPDAAAIERSSSSALRPATSTSENPAVTIQAARTPAAAHCSIADWTCWRGSLIERAVEVPPREVAE